MANETIQGSNPFSGDNTAALLLSAIVDSSEDAIISKDLDGVIRTWNKSAERLFGYTADEAIGQTVAALLIPPDRQDEEPDILRRLRQGERVDHFETVRRRKDGSLVDISLTISPVRDKSGNIIGASKIARDITAQVRARAQIHEMAERLRITLSSIGDAVVATDPGGAVTYLNPVAEELTGWPLSEAAGRPLPKIFHIVNEETRQEVENPVSKVLREGRVVGLANHTVLIARDGRECAIADSASPIRDGQGNIAGVVMVFRDNTESRQAAEALRFSEQRARAFLDNSAIIAWLKDEQGRNVFLSDNYVNRFGLKDWKNKTDFELWPRDIAETYQENDAIVLGMDRPLECVEEARTPNGDLSYWRNSKFWFQDTSGRKYVGGVGVDITEQQRTSVVIGTLIEQCPFGIYLVDSDFKIAQMNRRSQEGAFVNVRPVIGRPFDEAMRILWPEEVAADIIKKFRHTLETGQPYRSTDFVNRRADEDLVEGYEWELHRLVLPDGRYGVICYYFDSTRLRETERALRESQQQLEAEARGLARLNELGALLWQASSLKEGLDEMLAATIERLGADMGNIQLLEGDTLRIAAQSGFKQDFLDFFREVSTKDDSACGRALRAGERTVIEDVETDEPYAPMRPVARAAGYRGCNPRR